MRDTNKGSVKNCRHGVTADLETDASLCACTLSFVNCAGNCILVRSARLVACGVLQPVSINADSNSVYIIYLVFIFYLKSATKPLNVLIAFTRPLITEFADNLNLKHPLLPTISPYPTM